MVRTLHAAWRALALVLLLGLPLAWSQPPEVRQLSLQRTPEALYLNARLGIAPHGAVQDALLKGVPLYFVWEATVLRERWYWTDRRVAAQRRVLRLAYQPLTRLWRVSLSTDNGGGTGGAGLQYALHQNHDTLEEALAAIGRASRWRLADAGQLEPGAEHHVQFDFRLDLTLLPRPFQIGLGSQAEWSMQFSQELQVPNAPTAETASDS
ncbi:MULTISPECIES: DUF4390 domain-containing protein [Hydrogenophaga]|uniref:DUF4390 domain-containing protein n=1 Tax=Hydrogenophaga TaxID=47420 RepID=UPI001F0E4AAA|nr:MULTISPECIES: DUF4390 domain-containing protein [Hydrogenophaga]